jgi:hypothetical protein
LGIKLVLLSHISPFIPWLPTELLTKIAGWHIYFDNLTIPKPSRYDKYPDYSKIRTPYSTLQFQLFLERAKLLEQYPELPFKITYGFPLSDITPVLQSYTLPNLPSALIHSNVIREYIAEELRLGHFTGPYTKQELKKLMGPFHTSPFQVATKVSACGQPDKYRVCQHLSFKGELCHSINDDIDAKEYPTRWGKATDMAKIVCLYHLCLASSRPVLI